MKTLELKKIEHPYKTGMDCPEIEPNIDYDCLMIENGRAVGFYLRKMPQDICKVANFCNDELLSHRVPKQMMDRSSGVKQYSTIIGAVPKKPHFRRDYKTISSVHGVKSAKPFILGMKLLAKKCSDLIKEIIPEEYERQRKTIEENVLEKYRMADLWTSSISNFNISANFHIDNANLKDCSNVIVGKRSACKGGNTFVPDYDACFFSDDNSLLVYPAWKSLHGVTPIVPMGKGGYRNTLVFYPLKGFDKE